MKKKRFLPVICFCFFLMNSYSQTYIPLLNNTSWNVRTYHNPPLPIPENHFIQQGIPVNFDAVSYLKFDNYLPAFPTVYLREDLRTKKVYRRYNGTDQILYDFSLEDGNLITLGNGSIYVARVYYVFISGAVRKKIILSITETNLSDALYYDNEVWIEGIGSLRHPLVPSYQLQYTDNGDNIEGLTCAYQNNIVTFGGSECAALLSTIDSNQLTQTMRFYPNPFNSELIIDLNSYLENITIKLFNSQGQLIKQDSNLKGQIIKLNRDNLPSGLYFIQLLANQKILQTAKVMVN